MFSCFDNGLCFGTTKKIDDNKSESKQTEQSPNNPLDVQEGKKRFILHCATCHGSDAKGKTGPNIIGVTSQDIAEEIAGNSAMTFMQGVVTKKDYRFIAIYLDFLKIDNSTYLGRQFWKGRAKNLKEQAKGLF